MTISLETYEAKVASYVRRSKGNIWLERKILQAKQRLSEKDRFLLRLGINYKETSYSWE